LSQNNLSIVEDYTLGATHELVAEKDVTKFSP
jgi:hypothetical protein